MVAQTIATRGVCIVFTAALWQAVFPPLMMADDSGSIAWVAPASAAEKQNPIAADDKSIAAGKAIYVIQCLRCHGDAGKGDGPTHCNPKPKDFSDPAVAGQSDGALFWKITTGRKLMPAFEMLISEPDRWNTVNYIRTLAPPPSARPATQPAAGQ